MGDVGCMINRSCIPAGRSHGGMRVTFPGATAVAGQLHNSQWAAVQPEPPPTPDGQQILHSPRAPHRC